MTAKLVQRQTKPGKQEVFAIKVDPRIWEVAMGLALGNAKRITIHHAHSVTVHNYAVR